MNAHELMERDHPLIYDLGVDSGSFWISVCPEVADAIESFFIKALSLSENERFKRRVIDLGQELELGEFVAPFRICWGFDEVIQTIERHEGTSKFILWSFAFPAYPTSFDDKETQAFYRRMMCISASLQLLFRALNSVTPPKNEEKKQLVMVDGLMTQAKQNGGALTIVLSKVFCEKYVQRYSRSQGMKTGVGAMMMLAHKRMTRGIAVYGSSDFRISMEEGSKFIMLSCPGNACGLTPHDRADENDDEGYELVSHNVDSPIQQLILLCGIGQILNELSPIDLSNVAN